MDEGSTAVILKAWGHCPENGGDLHWARYVFQDDKEYWCKERIDEERNCWWRHYEFMSLPCAKCGAYSPLRCSNMFSTNNGYKSCDPDEIIDYRPTDSLPDTIGRYREKGFYYYFFKETLSDSLCGQETFRLKEMPE